MCGLVKIPRILRYILIVEVIEYCACWSLWSDDRAYGISDGWTITSSRPGPPSANITPVFSNSNIRPLSGRNARQRIIKSWLCLVCLYVYMNSIGGTKYFRVYTGYMNPGEHLSRSHPTRNQPNRPSFDRFIWCSSDTITHVYILYGW